MTIWDILDIAETSNQKAIKLAYAKKLKIHSPEKDPEGFQQLRHAYELAIDFANGIQINHQMGNSQQTSFTSLNSETTQNKPTEMLVEELLVLLEKDEAKAVDYLQALTKQGDLDNLDNSDKFQRLLAIRLTAYTPQYADFIISVIDHFDWHARLETEPDGTYAKLALINLFNTVNHHALRRHIHRLSLIKNKKEAEEKYLDWDDCQAAQFFSPLLAPAHLRNIKRNNKKRSQAIAKLYNTITNTPEVIGLNLHLESIIAWRQHINAQKNNLSFSTIATIAAVIIFIISVVSDVSPEENQNNSSITAATNVSPQDSQDSADTNTQINNIKINKETDEEIQNRIEKEIPRIPDI